MARGIRTPLALVNHLWPKESTQRGRHLDTISKILRSA